MHTKARRAAIRLTAGGAVLVAMMAFAWGRVAEAQNVNVRFRLDWFPKGIHALFWTAKAKGFYDEQNLNVTIVPGDGSGNTVKLVGSGEFDFGFADGPTGIVGRSRGIPVVVIGAVHQKNPQGIVSLKESGIAKPKDLEGKTFGIQPQASTYPFWLAFAKMNTVDRDKIREFNMPGEVPVFVLEKRVQAAAVLYDNELITIESKLGGPGRANFMLGYDYGFRTYGHSLFTSEKMVRERPDVVRGKVLSVVVPCFNEQELLPESYRRLTAVLRGIPAEYEIIFVDDGSTDASAAILAKLAGEDDHVRVVGLSRNFGHQMAITAGVEHASGDAVVLIDADLQDPPELISDFFAEWVQGYEVVYGVRRVRGGETVFKRWTANVFYRLLAGLSDTPIPLDSGDFRLMDRQVVSALLRMPERDRFVRGMVSWLGFRQKAVPYDRNPRLAGGSKDPFGKVRRLALDAIFSFSAVPLRLATWTGLAASGVALVGIVYALFFRVFTRDWVPGWATVFIAVLFIGGVQLSSLGIIGDYLGRVYGESKQRPLYVVRERIGFARERAVRSAAPDTAADVQ